MLVRIMAPDGTLGNIPEEQVEAAVLAGAKVMSKQDLKDMYQSVFMAHTLVTEQKKKVLAKFQPRQSMRQKMRKRK